MTPTARVAADIDAILLHALIDETPIPGYGARWPGGLHQSAAPCPAP
jgi:hypothetical protein